MRRSIRNPQSPIRNRAGVTLSEVLVALGLTSVGLVTLATLFPLSILRTVQATQLTNATIVRYNVEATIEAFPELVHDPDGLPGTNNTDPKYNSPYVVDPLGYSVIETDNSTLKDDFGNEDIAGTPTPVNGVKRYPFNFAGNFDGARNFVSSHDSWTEVVTAIPTALAGTPRDTATFSEDLSAVSQGDRIVFFSDDGRGSIARTITADPSGGTVTFGAIPDGFAVGNARIETKYFRYSWYLTVRKSSGIANVDVAVFFNRKFAAKDEQLYQCTLKKGSPAVTLIRKKDDPEPDLKNGAWLLDGANLHWYRVARIDGRTTDGSTGDETITLTLAEGAKVDSDRAMVPPQLVDVYPMGLFRP